MDRIAIAIGSTAACIHAAGYLVYSFQAKTGRSKPRTSVMGVPTFLIIILAVTYYFTTTEMALTLQYIVASVASSASLAYMAWTKKLVRLTKEEYIYAAFGVIAGVVWFVYHNAAYANLLILATVIVSYKTMYQGIWRNPYTETPWSWLLWTLAYAINTVNAVHLGKEWPAFISPVVLLFAHLAVAVLSSRWRKRRFTARTGITRA